jgi:hypothetical protein
MTNPNRFILRDDTIKRNALQAVAAAGDGYVVTISKPTRSNQQNARMWASLSDIANARPEGRQWTPETWKCAFLHSLGHQVRFAEGLDGSGPFPIGFHSSTLTVGQMADLITVIQEYGDRHGVAWTETIKGGFLELQERAA